MNQETTQRRIAVITGSRAEFGLLAPVMHAIRGHPGLELVTIAAGSHYLPPAFTHRDVSRSFGIDAIVRMQQARATGADGAGEPSGRLLGNRFADAAAVGRGVSGFTLALAKWRPSAVVVLGDRIEAFAGAAAASVAGIPLAHIHGGDRAEGIADEAMRHAVSKLAHLHFPATRESADRLARLGEAPTRIHATGSPAIDGLNDLSPMSDDAAASLGDPLGVLLLHPAGLAPADEQRTARIVCESMGLAFGRRVLALAPNHDAGRAIIQHEIENYSERFGWRRADHLPREAFVSLLKRLSAVNDRTRGVLVGNSSAALIEAAATRTIGVNVGPRQDGREQAGNILNLASPGAAELRRVLERAMTMPPDSVPPTHPYGDGAAGRRIARVLAETDLHDPLLLRKRNTY